MEKKIDHEWKKQVQREKEEMAKEQGGVKTQVRKASFISLVSDLSLQASVFLGELHHPQTGKKEVSLENARYLIDLLGILEEKTKGNLSEEEQVFLSSVLYQLRMGFVEKSQRSGK